MRPSISVRCRYIMYRRDLVNTTCHVQPTMSIGVVIQSRLLLNYLLGSKIKEVKTL